MKNKMKTMFATIVVLLCSVTINAHDFEVDGIYYNITSATDLTVAVTYKGSDHSSAVYSGDIVIPSSVSYNGNMYSVTSIGDYAFSGCSGLTNVSIPNSVTSIDDYAFSGCSGLTNVSIPNSVTRIDKWAFPSNVILTENNIQYVDTWAVGVVDKEKTSYTLRTGTIGIAEAAFKDCFNMKSVDLPNSLKHINYRSFYGCCDLNGINLPSNVLNIGAEAFYGCTTLDSVIIPKSVTNMSDAFKQCKNLIEVTINSSAVVGKDYKQSQGLQNTFGKQVKVYNIGDEITQIGSWAFSDCDSLITINLPSDINRIGTHCFDGSRKLKNIVLPDSLTSIDLCLFDDCTSLSSLIIPESVISIGGSAFDGCTNLSSITLPEGLTSIGNSAFCGCSSLASITIPSNVTSIGYGAFTNLNSVTINSNSIISKDFSWHPHEENSCLKYIFGTQVKEYTIGGNVEKIGDYAFYECDSLTTVKITSDLDSIGSCVFKNCTNLSSITIPSGVTNIGNAAFQGCTNLSSITIPSNVTNIGNGAFQGCTSLSSITIPENVVSIEIYAFESCDSLANVTINSNSFISKDFSQSELSEKPCLKYIFGTQVKEYTIGGNVEKIGDYAFYECDSLTTVRITSDLDSIGSCVFYNCAKLEEVIIPDNVKYIGSSAFYGCTSLPVENNIRYAGTWAIGVTDNTLPRYILRSNTRGLFRTFSGCSLMTRVTLPDSLRNIGDNAFYGCSSIKNLTLPSRVNYIGSSAFSGCSSLASLTIPDGVTAIGCSTFYGCSALTSMIIPDNVESLGASLFYNCHNLSSVTLPKGLTKIENSTFYGCNLSDFEMPESVTSIGSYAFYDNPLSAIVIPSTVTSIGDYAFSNCYNLDTVTVNSADIMANGKFSKVFGENITNYNIGGNIKELADFAFFNYQKIKKITLPESLETIGESAFESCVNLDSVTLPKNVANIGAYAFASCTALKSVVSNNPVPPVCGEEAFYEVETANCSLEVPDSVVSLYSETAPWSDFNIVGVVIPTAMALVDGEVYDNKKELAMDSITYTRTFNNTNWQALYVPFAMNYEDWSADFDVAKINDIHQFDINGDGDFSDEGVDKTIMEMLIVNSGSLKPNHPYMIRAKAKGQKTITVKNAVLMPAQSKSIDCSSVEQKYVFTGTYNVIDGETMVAGKYYAMSGGSVKYTSSTANSLKPFRWYMQIQNRDGQVIQDVSEVKVVVRGEDDWDATGIDEIDTEENIYTIYSVDGRAIRSIKATTIEEATQGIASGMYIINGKKHFVK